MDVMVGAMRGLGYAVLPMIVSLTGACLFRVVWIFTIFSIPQYHTLNVLYLSYAISWILTFTVELIVYLVIMRKYKNSEA